MIRCIRRQADSTSEIASILAKTGDRSAIFEFVVNNHLQYYVFDGKKWVKFQNWSSRFDHSSVLASLAVRYESVPAFGIQFENGKVQWYRPVVRRFDLPVINGWVRRSFAVQIQADEPQHRPTDLLSDYAAAIEQLRKESADLPEAQVVRLLISALRVLALYQNPFQVAKWLQTAAAACRLSPVRKPALHAIAKKLDECALLISSSHGMLPLRAFSQAIETLIVMIETSRGKKLPTAIRARIAFYCDQLSGIVWAGVQGQIQIKKSSSDQESCWGFRLPTGDFMVTTWQCTNKKTGDRTTQFTLHQTTIRHLTPLISIEFTAIADRLCPPNANPKTTALALPEKPPLGHIRIDLTPHHPAYGHFASDISDWVRQMASALFDISRINQPKSRVRSILAETQGDTVVAEILSDLPEKMAMAGPPLSMGTGFRSWVTPRTAMVATGIFASTQLAINYLAIPGPEPDMPQIGAENPIDTLLSMLQSPPDSDSKMGEVIGKIPLPSLQRLVANVLAYMHIRNTPFEGGDAKVMLRIFQGYLSDVVQILGSASPEAHGLKEEMQRSIRLIETATSEKWPYFDGTADTLDDFQIWLFATQIFPPQSIAEAQKEVFLRYFPPETVPETGLNEIDFWNHYDSIVKKLVRDGFLYSYYDSNRGITYRIKSTPFSSKPQVSADLAVHEKTIRHIFGIPAEFNQFYSRISSKISALEIGGRYLLPAGHSSRYAGHSILIMIEKAEAGILYVSIINTGQGSQNHVAAPLPNEPYRFNPIWSVTIPMGSFLTDCLPQILYLVAVRKDSEAESPHETDNIYPLLLANGAILSDRTVPVPIASRGQYSGNCWAFGTLIWMHEIFQSPSLGRVAEFVFDYRLLQLYESSQQRLDHDLWFSHSVTELAREALSLFNEGLLPESTAIAIASTLSNWRTRASKRIQTVLFEPPLNISIKARPDLVPLKSSAGNTNAAPQRALPASVPIHIKDLFKNPELFGKYVHLWAETLRPPTRHPSKDQLAINAAWNAAINNRETLVNQLGEVVTNGAGFSLQLWVIATIVNWSNQFSDLYDTALYRHQNRYSPSIDAKLRLYLYRNLLLLDWILKNSDETKELLQGFSFRLHHNTPFDWINGAVLSDPSAWDVLDEIVGELAQIPEGPALTDIPFEPVDPSQNGNVIVWRRLMASFPDALRAANRRQLELEVAKFPLSIKLNANLAEFWYLFNEQQDLFSPSSPRFSRVTGIPVGIIGFHSILFNIRSFMAKFKGESPFRFLGNCDDSTCKVEEEIQSPNTDDLKVANIHHVISKAENSGRTRSIEIDLPMPNWQKKIWIWIFSNRDTRVETALELVHRFQSQLFSSEQLFELFNSALFEVEWIGSRIESFLEISLKQSHRTVRLLSQFVTDITTTLLDLDAVDNPSGKHILQLLAQISYTLTRISDSETDLASLRTTIELQIQRVWDHLESKLSAGTADKFEGIVQTFDHAAVLFSRHPISEPIAFRLIEAFLLVNLGLISPMNSAGIRHRIHHRARELASFSSNADFKSRLAQHVWAILPIHPKPTELTQRAIELLIEAIGNVPEHPSQDFFELALTGGNVMNVISRTFGNLPVSQLIQGHQFKSVPEIPDLFYESDFLDGGSRDAFGRPPQAYKSDGGPYYFIRKDDSFGSQLVAIVDILGQRFGVFSYTGNRFWSYPAEYPSEISRLIKSNELIMMYCHSNTHSTPSTGPIKVGITRDGEVRFVFYHNHIDQIESGQRVGVFTAFRGILIDNPNINELIVMFRGYAYGKSDSEISRISVESLRLQLDVTTEAGISRYSLNGNSVVTAPELYRQLLGPITLKIITVNDSESGGFRVLVPYATWYPDSNRLQRTNRVIRYGLCEIEFKSNFDIVPPKSRLDRLYLAYLLSTDGHSNRILSLLSASQSASAYTEEEFDYISGILDAKSQSPEDVAIRIYCIWMLHESIQLEMNPNEEALRILISEKIGKWLKQNLGLLKSWLVYIDKLPAQFYLRAEQRKVLELANDAELNHLLEMRKEHSKHYPFIESKEPDALPFISSGNPLSATPKLPHDHFGSIRSRYFEEIHTRRRQTPVALPETNGRAAEINAELVEYFNDYVVTYRLRPSVTPSEIRSNITAMIQSLEITLNELETRLSDLLNPDVSRRPSDVIRALHQLGQDTRELSLDDLLPIFVSDRLDALQELIPTIDSEQARQVIQSCHDLLMVHLDIQQARRVLSALESSRHWEQAVSRELSVKNTFVEHHNPHYRSMLVWQYLKTYRFRMVQGEMLRNARSEKSVVLQAPTGAGKSTFITPTLLIHKIRVSLARQLSPRLVGVMVLDSLFKQTHQYLDGELSSFGIRVIPIPFERKFKINGATLRQLKNLLDHAAKNSCAVLLRKEDYLSIINTFLEFHKRQASAEEIALITDIVSHLIECDFVNDEYDQILRDKDHYFTFGDPVKLPRVYPKVQRNVLELLLNDPEIRAKIAEHPEHFIRSQTAGVQRIQLMNAEFYRRELVPILSARLVTQFSTFSFFSSPAHRRNLELFLSSNQHNHETTVILLNFLVAFRQLFPDAASELVLAAKLIHEYFPNALQLEAGKQFGPHLSDSAEGKRITLSRQFAIPWKTIRVISGENTRFQIPEIGVAATFLYVVNMGLTDAQSIVMVNHWIAQIRIELAQGYRVAPTAEMLKQHCGPTVPDFIGQICLAIMPANAQIPKVTAFINQRLQLLLDYADLIVETEAQEYTDVVISSAYEIDTQHAVGFSATHDAFRYRESEISVPSAESQALAASLLTRSEFSRVRILEDESPQHAIDRFVDGVVKHQYNTLMDGKGMFKTLTPLEVASRILSKLSAIPNTPQAVVFVANEGNLNRKICYLHAQSSGHAELFDATRHKHYICYFSHADLIGVDIPQCDKSIIFGLIEESGQPMIPRIVQTLGRNRQLVLQELASRDSFSGSAQFEFWIDAQLAKRIRAFTQKSSISTADYFYYMSHVDDTDRRTTSIQTLVKQLDGIVRRKAIRTLIQLRASDTIDAEIRARIANCVSAMANRVDLDPFTRNLQLASEISTIQYFDLYIEDAIRKYHFLDGFDRAEMVRTVYRMVDLNVMAQTLSRVRKDAAAEAQSETHSDQSVQAEVQSYANELPAGVFEEKEYPVQLQAFANNPLTDSGVADGAKAITLNEWMDSTAFPASILVTKNFVQTTTEDSARFAHQSRIKQPHFVLVKRSKRSVEYLLISRAEAGSLQQQLRHASAEIKGKITIQSVGSKIGWLTQFDAQNNDDSKIQVADSHRVFVLLHALSADQSFEPKDTQVLSTFLKSSRVTPTEWNNLFTLWFKKLERPYTDSLLAKLLKVETDQSTIRMNRG